MPDASGSSWKLWRKRLETFDQLDYESSLDKPPLNEIRLVDERKWQNDPELWLQLLRFRERVDGLQGVAVIWRGYAQRAIPLRESQASLELWNSFLRLGFQDHGILHELCRYNGSLAGRDRGKTIGLYYGIMKHIILTKPSELQDWHLLLKHESPYAWQCRELLNLAIVERSSIRAFLDIYEDLPLLQEYRHIIPKLCAQGLYSDAFQWHRMLVRKGDLPPDASVVQPLLDHLKSSNEMKAYNEVMETISDTGVALPTSSVPTRQHSSVVYQEIMNELQTSFRPTKPKAISDAFCARLFATKAFSVHSIMNGLHMFGVETIGPLALREIAARAIEHGTIHPETVIRDLDQLRQTGISVGGSKFSRLVQKAAREFDAELLFDIVSSDQHPEVYENWKLQESLLASYHKVGDRRQINRTLAILTLDETKKSLDTARWNLLLRCYLTLGDMPNTWATMDKMCNDGIALRKASRTYLWSRTIAASKAGQLLTKAGDSICLIKLWQGFMRSGTPVPPGAWVQILRRLGLLGQLKQYEDVACWLARWYTDEGFRFSQVELEGRQRSVRRPLIGVVPLDQADADPLPIIFSEQMVKAVFAWGFKYHVAINSQGTPPSERARILSHAPCLWGLRLITKLRDIGVKVDREVVATACKTSLATMRRPVVSDPLAKRHHRGTHRIRQEEHALAMEIIWGGPLFESDESRLRIKNEDRTTAG